MYKLFWTLVTIAGVVLFVVGIAKIVTILLMSLFVMASGIGSLFTNKQPQDSNSNEVTFYYVYTGKGGSS